MPISIERERVRRVRAVLICGALIGLTALLAQAMEATDSVAGGAAPHGVQTTAATPANGGGLVAVAPRIEVAFVLDTTGSMSGLIEGAKQKVWSIVNQMSDGTPRPDIRVALVGYRDRGDAYVTRRSDLTGDIDSIYSELSEFRAGGGGDGPESVNQALHEAVTQLSWSQSQGVYRVIFLVGDAPPHMDYPDDVQYPEVVGLARDRGIVINTVQCGSVPATVAVWREIARSGAGEFAAIAQDGGMVAMKAPMDKELVRLNRELSSTALAFGSREEKQALKDKLEEVDAAPSTVVAERLAYLGKNGGGLASGASDLVEAYAQGAVDLDDLPEASLPEPMQAMVSADRVEFLEQKGDERAALRKKIDELTKERDVYVRTETERRGAEGKANGFDDKVLETIRGQAEAAGIRYR